MYCKGKLSLPLSIYDYNIIYMILLTSLHMIAKDKVTVARSLDSELKQGWPFTQFCKLPIWFAGQHGEFGPRGAGSDELKLEACWWFNHKGGKVNKCSMFTLTGYSNPCKNSKPMTEERISTYIDTIYTCFWTWLSLAFVKGLLLEKHSPLRNPFLQIKFRARTRVFSLPLVQRHYLAPVTVPVACFHYRVWCRWPLGFLQTCQVENIEQELGRNFQ